MREEITVQMARKSKSGFHLSSYSLLAPFERLLHFQDVPAVGKLSVLGAAAMSLIVSEKLFLLALILLACSNALDYYLGRKVAKLGKGAAPYSPVIAHAGAISKISGIAVLLLVRGLEGLLQMANVFDTHGVAATALTVAMITIDIDSVLDHRQLLGAKPIPVLSAFMRTIRGWVEKAVPGSTPPSGGQ